MASPQNDAISVAEPATVGYGGRVAPAPPPPPPPSITLSSTGAATAGGAYAVTVTAANLTGPLTVTPERVSGPSASFSPTTVLPAPGELVKLFSATAAAAGTLRLRATAPGSIVSNEIDIVVNAAPAPGPTPPPPPPTLSAFDTGINGVWTWFTTPVCVYHDGATYFSPVDSSGNSEIHRYDHAMQTTTSFTLSSSPDLDDHNNGSIEVLDDGKLIAYWATHYDTAVRFRVSTNSGDVSAWGSVQSLTAASGSVTYPVPVRLSGAGDKRWLFYRHTNGSGVQSLVYRTSANFSGGSGSASAQSDICTTSGATPYWRIASAGVNRIDVILVNRHPVQGDNELYHFYATPDGSNNLKFYKSNGTEITASGPWDIATEATIAVSGEVRRKWIWDVVRNGSEVWVLWTRFWDFAGTDHRLMFSRCNSSNVWQTPVEIVAQGQYLYAGERYYSPGACFDSVDPTTIYLSAPVSGVNQVQRWATTNGGTSWSQQQVYTSGGTAGTPRRARPFSPKNHNGQVPVLWWQGRYTTYLDYDTNIWGAR
jgi:hypothetical protein